MGATAMRALAVGLAVASGTASAGFPMIAPGSAYRQTNLVSDVPGLANVNDIRLVNPWGVTRSSTSPFWVSNAGTSTGTLYREAPGGDTLVIDPTLPRINLPGGLPTGVVVNTTSDFDIVSGLHSGPPAFLFASITGNLVGWSPAVPPGNTTGVIGASRPGHVFTGLTIGNNGANRVYAADFAQGVIDVFTATYASTTVSGNFADPTIPDVDGNRYHPHNIQLIGGLLYVAYAKVGNGGLQENGAGNGYVRRFNTNGVRDLTFAINNGALDAPWGMAIAPASFGIFGGALLVGNFSDNGRITAYNPTTGAFLGTVQDEGGNAVSIDQLRGLSFGNDSAAGDAGALYFTAGIGNEDHGLFGSLRPTTATATTLIEFSSGTYSVNEYAGGINITVLRDGDVSGASTVRYAGYVDSMPGQASAADYTLTPGTLNFAPNETSRTFFVSVKKDGMVETPESLTLALSNASGSALALDEARLTITDPGVFANGFE